MKPEKNITEMTEEEIEKEFFNTDSPTEEEIIKALKEKQEEDRIKEIEEFQRDAMLWEEIKIPIIMV